MRNLITVSPLPRSQRPRRKSWDSDLTSNYHGQPVTAPWDPASPIRTPSSTDSRTSLAPTELLLVCVYAFYGIDGTLGLVTGPKYPSHLISQIFKDKRLNSIGTATSPTQYNFQCESHGMQAFHFAVYLTSEQKFFFGRLRHNGSCLYSSVLLLARGAVTGSIW